MSPASYRAAPPRVDLTRLAHPCPRLQIGQPATTRRARPVQGGPVAPSQPPGVGDGEPDGIGGGGGSDNEDSSGDESGPPDGQDDG